ncbi:hypothetical protein N7509_003879 [Penicillium cosmopolitanum]|uniref:Aminoglycoside phosphotransferase domain-containing protein n=1 Tax=Penicillium cosmopolitanum TaxID=1131564 RepID=A0A9X0BBW5_9EURO|nr:uncharacterized protein N7509_003879 [Penicillium cosmopolitanum]KAJ5404008.1 hypothetical protein N7509_003879 [Penicillium cosmopolitanum]
MFDWLKRLIFASSETEGIISHSESQYAELQQTKADPDSKKAKKKLAKEHSRRQRARERQLTREFNNQDRIWVMRGGFGGAGGSLMLKLADARILGQEILEENDLPVGNEIFYGASTRGVWSIGSDVILKDRPDEGPKARVEVKTLNYLATHTDIPIPKVLRDWVDRDGRYFVLNERIGGQKLEEAWNSLSERQKIDVADQVVKVRKQLRSVPPMLSRYDDS